MNDDLHWLQKWRAGQCDGDWEHHYGVRIVTIDNPGWYVKIALKETELEQRQFLKIKIDRSEQDWILCFVRDGYFEGAGGLFNLPEILGNFRIWAEEHQ